MNASRRTCRGSGQLFVRVSRSATVILVAFVISGFLSVGHRPLSRAHAATISPAELGPYQTIRPIAAIVRQGSTEQPAPPSLHNGDGLSHSNPLRATHGSDAATLWQHAFSDSESVSIDFDLGADFMVNEMWVWQLPGESLQDQGIKEFDIRMRDAEGREVGFFDGDITKLKGVRESQPRFNAFGECVFLPFSDMVRFVELTIHDNRGNPDFVGLAEILFAGRQKVVAVPEPAGLLLGVFGAWLAFRFGLQAH